jgi:uncharacterized membrane protein
MEIDAPLPEETPPEVSEKNVTFICIGVILLIVALMSWIVYIPIFSDFFIGEILGIIFLYKGFRP